MLSFKLRGHSAFADKLSSIPRAVRGKACEAAAFTLMGNERKGLKYYPSMRPGQTYTSPVYVDKIDFHYASNIEGSFGEWSNE